MTQKTRSCRLIAIFPRNEFNALQWSSTKYQTSLRRNRKELTKVALRLHNSELFHDLGVNKTKRPDFYLRISYIMHLLCYRHSFEKKGRQNRLLLSLNDTQTCLKYFMGSIHSKISFEHSISDCCRQYKLNFACL